MLDSAAGRWVVAASVLGSGTVFLESTVVNVALPAIGRDLGLALTRLQWIVSGYLLTLSALMLLGGALGDRFDRWRVFALGALAFAASCIGAALAPTAAALLSCRLVQGAAGALLVPNSLALLETSFRAGDRARAIGRWAAWSAASTALGPVAGGWLVRVGSWRWVFASVVPFALAAAWAASRRSAYAPSAETRVAPARIAAPTRAPIDYVGAVLATAGLAAGTWALIDGPVRGFEHPVVLGAAAFGVAALAAFVAVERHAPRPLLPLAVFRSRQFTGANVVTLLVYAALGGLFFLLMLELQGVLGYDPLAAGLALLPLNALTLLLSPVAGRLAQRVGPRAPMTVGALAAGAGMLLFARVRPGTTYVQTVLPALLVFGTGLATLVAPLTAAVLGAVDDRLAGVASALNNAVARLGGLLATAALPLAAGLGTVRDPSGGAFADGFARAMVIGAALCVAGAVVAWGSVRRGAAVPPLAHPHPTHACLPARGRPPGS